MSFLVTRSSKLLDLSWQIGGLLTRLHRLLWCLFAWGLWTRWHEIFLPVAKLQCGARIRTVAPGILDVRHGEAVARGFAGQGRSSEAKIKDVITHGISGWRR